MAEQLSADIFCLPILDLALVYAPLHSVSALVARGAVGRVRDGVSEGRPGAASGPLADLIELLRPAVPRPRSRTGPFLPAFLGLIPTRACNLACTYCGFLDSAPGGDMPLDLARDAVAWYFDLAGRAGIGVAEIHFFGGEPFCAPAVMDCAFHFARLRSEATGCAVRFEVATNGTLDAERCRLAADNLDSVVLSLDGPAAVQDHYRPRRNGTGSLQAAVQSARILSEGSTELAIRVCVTDETAGVMPDTAAWLCREFRPTSVCFETLQPTAASGATGLVPPDPWAFAFNFLEAARLLAAHGVEAVYAPADTAICRASFCPVGQDVAIVSPDGSIAACYLLPRDVAARGLDLSLGAMAGGGARLDPHRIEAARRLNVWNKPFCAACFCRWHCAGGCHVNHVLAGRPGDYDRLCLQARIVTLARILASMGRRDVWDRLMRRPDALETAIFQASDLLAGWEDRP